MRTSIEDEVMETMLQWRMTEKEWFSLPLEERTLKIAHGRNSNMKTYLSSLPDKEAAQVRTASDWL